MKNEYPHLFAPLEIRGRVLRNRIMSAPNMLFQVVDGRPTDYYVGYLEHKAKGGAAIVNMGEVNICDGSSHTPRIVLEDKNRNIFGEIASSIKQHGALASAELTHGGRNARQMYNTHDIIGPVTEVSERGEHVRAMTIDDMNDVADAFADAAQYCMDCGFDIAHVHAGHSWLFPQFLSPFINTRTDEFGGSLENRMRFPLMCLKRMRERVGNKMIISMRLSGSERREGGFTPADIAEFLSKAQEYIDFVEITTDGWLYSMPTSYLPYALNRPFAAEIKHSGKVNIPVFLLGCIVSAEMAEEIIASGDADGVSMSRALIADPTMPNKVKAGREADVIPCLRCMRCTDGDNATRFFHCSVNPVTGHETRNGFMEDIVPAKHKRKVLVIGAGPAGVEAAATAADRGHEVTLVEKLGEVGGTVRYAENDKLKPDMQRYLAYMRHRVDRAEIKLMLNTEATPELVESLAPDHVIVATGATAVAPKFISGWERAHHVMDAYLDPNTIKGDNIVVIGGGLAGAEAAVYMGEMGKKVTILEKFTSLAGVGTCYGWGVMDAEKRYGVELREHVSCTEIGDGYVKFTDDETGAEEELNCDSVFYAVGMRSDRDLYYKIADKAPFVDLIGDSKQVARIGEATAGGYFAALDIGTF
ncbi:MAG: FAD-dependent oxidoreductase [Coriobacteriales bacterium]|jgi:2,4-dienoyl-CoA reductase-like NADH-dependent reductase (Old Yellow Enzyme family)/thioredoxin reductase